MDCHDDSGSRRVRTFFVVVYLFFSLMTNSYLQVYRLAEWKRNLPYYDRPLATVMFISATAFWPVYWASVFTQELIKPKGIANEQKDMEA